MPTGRSGLSTCIMEAEGDEAPRPTNPPCWEIAKNPWVCPDDGVAALVHYGDEALVRPESLRRLIATGVSQAAPIALLNARVRDPSGYGRVIRLPDGTVDAMVEEVDATPAQREIREINTGILAAPAKLLKQWLPQLSANNAQGEYYLTDIIGLAAHGTNDPFAETNIGIVNLARERIGAGRADGKARIHPRKPANGAVT